MVPSEPGNSIYYFVNIFRQHSALKMTFQHFLALLASILAGKSGCSPLNISEQSLHYFGNYCDYFCQIDSSSSKSSAKGRQQLSSTKACRPFAELLLLELSILTKIITIITKIINTTPQNDLFRVFGIFGVNS